MTDLIEAAEAAVRAELTEQHLREITEAATRHGLDREELVSGVCAVVAWQRAASGDPTFGLDAARWPTTLEREVSGHVRLLFDSPTNEVVQDVPSSVCDEALAVDAVMDAVQHEGMTRSRVSVVSDAAGVERVEIGLYFFGPRPGWWERAKARVQHAANSIPCQVDVEVVRSDPDGSCCQRYTFLPENEGGEAGFEVLPWDAVT